MTDEHQTSAPIPAPKPLHRAVAALAALGGAVVVAGVLVLAKRGGAPEVRRATDEPRLVSPEGRARLERRSGRAAAAEVAPPAASSTSAAGPAPQQPRGRLLRELERERARLRATPRGSSAEEAAKRLSPER